MDSDDEIFLTQNTFSQEPFSPELNLEELVGDFREVSERDSVEVEKKENPGRNIVVVCDNEVEKRRESRIPTNTKVNTSWAVRCWEEWTVERNGTKTCPVTPIVSSEASNQNKRSLSAHGDSHMTGIAGLAVCLLQLNGIECKDVKKLLMMNAVYRHGNRSPTHIYPNDPYKEDVWPQGLGMLTQKGMRQEYALGKFLKKRYMEEFKLLNSTYIHKELYIRSTDVDRCLMSAQTQLNGLYPPRGNQIWRDNLDWQPIGIHVVPKKDDYLLRPFDYKCPRFLKLRDEDKKQPSYINMSLQYKDMLDYVSEKSGEKTEVSTAFLIRDPLISEESQNMTLPDWVLNGTTYKDLGTVGDFSMMWNFNTREKARLTGGALVGRMIENMKLALSPPNPKEPVRKAYLYSAHDTTVSAFLSALQVFDGISPDFSSAAILELFSSAKGVLKPSLSVRVLYRFGQNVPKILTLPGCEEFCPLERFIELTADVIPENIEKECALEQEKCTCFKVIDYKVGGCYKDRKGKNDTIFTKKFNTVKGVDRKNPDVEKIFLECKEMAEKEGYEIFAIQKVNICVTTASGKVADFKKFGGFKGCIVNKEGHGVGKRRAANFVYAA